MTATASFQHPIKMPRPRGTRLIEMFSVKLSRRFTAHSRSQFELLLAAEVNPRVTAYCERPIVLGSKPSATLADLWQRQDEVESFVILSDDASLESWMDIPVRRVGMAELAAMRQWLTNWQRMLPIVITTRDSIMRSLLRDVRRVVAEPMPLAYIERELVTGDPTLVRGGVFKLLLDGYLVAPSLHTEPLSLMTVFHPTQ